MDALGRRWATSGGGRLRRVPGEPGVTARLYADIRRPGSEGAASSLSSMPGSDPINVSASSSSRSVTGADGARSPGSRSSSAQSRVWTTSTPCRGRSSARRSRVLMAILETPTNPVRARASTSRTYGRSAPGPLDPAKYGLP
ncbi:DUF6207 family protein [Streptomyces atratus]|nr:DUF6207 family protein [Streptomyces atratus]MCX5340356.1 DUF6207 family protein [Streptomyces atratus]